VDITTATKHKFLHLKKLSPEEEPKQNYFSVFSFLPPKEDNLISPGMTMNSGQKRDVPSGRIPRLTNNIAVPTKIAYTGQNMPFSCIYIIDRRTHPLSINYLISLSYKSTRSL
jgi:hypothetical protein